MAEYVYDPVKEEQDGVKARRQIWSTKSLELAFEGLKKGKKLWSNPFYENKTNLLKADLNFQRTQEEEEEFIRCMNDILYFANKYCKLMTPEGIKTIKLRDYQERYLKHLQNNRLSIYLACRQCGKTTTSAIFMLWFILFNIDKNALVLGNKRKTAVEILDKAKNIYLALPFFLKPGVHKWNEAEIVLDNGCRLMCEATTVNSGISFTFHCVLADEFAHLPKNIMEPFYNNLFPTITAGRARFMITSTQHGFNLFYRLYTAAVAGDNDYAPFVTDWWEVPEWDDVNHVWYKRDEEWHRRQVGNLGGEDEFNEQFGTDFCGSAGSLINGKKIKEQMKDAYKYANIDMPGVSNVESWYWKSDFDLSTLKDHYHFITCDLAEGVGADSTVFNVIRVKIINGEFYYETVGYFKSNKLSLHTAHMSLAEFCSLYMVSERYYISVEWNTYGELFFSYVKEYEEKHGDFNYNSSAYIKYESARKNEFVPGFKLSANKAMCCSNFKRLYESNHYIWPDVKYLNELQSFGDINGNGKYAAVFGHDDMVMASVGITYIFQSLFWRSFQEEALRNGGKPNQSVIQFYDMYSF